MIYEDADTVVFPFMFPLTEGHLIVAPKQHFADIFEADPESLAKMMTVVQTVSQRMRLVLGINAVNLINNSGQAAGQDVFHFHMHIVPRRPGDQLNLKEWWLSKARAADEKELNDLAAKLEFRRFEP
jgi:histidine triad (HIT) family protein